VLTSAWVDRPPRNRTSWNVSFATKSGLGGRRFCREEEALFGRADHGDFEVGRLGYADSGAVSGAWGLGAEPLPLEEDYGAVEPSEARELKQLREENVKLKRLVADLSLDKSMLQDLLQKNF
jgi:hypothetical protein